MPGVVLDDIKRGIAGDIVGRVIDFDDILVLEQRLSVCILDFFLGIRKNVAEQACRSEGNASGHRPFPRDERESLIRQVGSQLGQLLDGGLRVLTFLHIIGGYSCSPIRDQAFRPVING
jgi:hypothetical protein